MRLTSRMTHFCRGRQLFKVDCFKGGRFAGRLTPVFLYRPRIGRRELLLDEPFIYMQEGSLRRCQNESRARDRALRPSDREKESKDKEVKTEKKYVYSTLR